MRKGKLSVSEPVISLHAKFLTQASKKTLTISQNTSIYVRNPMFLQWSGVSANKMIAVMFQERHFEVLF